MLKMTEGHRVRPRTQAVAHFCRTGAILPGHAGEVAEWMRSQREAAREAERARRTEWPSPSEVGPAGGGR